MFCYFSHEACGISAPWPGINLMPPALGGKFLTTGPPQKPPPTSLYFIIFLFLWFSKFVCSALIFSVASILPIMMLSILKWFYLSFSFVSFTLRIASYQFLLSCHMYFDSIYMFFKLFIQCQLLPRRKTVVEKVENTDFVQVMEESTMTNWNIWPGQQPKRNWVLLTTWVWFEAELHQSILQRWMQLQSTPWLISHLMRELKPGLPT